MARFSFADIQRAEKIIDPIFRNSPLFESESLGELFGCRVLLKIETLNPVRSFKGRGAELLTGYAKEKLMACASAGNFGQAMAWSCRKRGIDLTVYASIHANAFKVQRMKDFGVKVIQEGEDFDTSKAIARKFAASKNIRFVEDSLDVETVIGAGTIGIELADSKQPLDVVLVPLGNGALINGVGMALKYRSPNTSVVGVQSQNAPAMIESWRTGRTVTHDTIKTIADGIGVRIPVTEALAEMKEFIDDGILVKEETIIKAMQMMRLHTGLIVEPSAAVGLAAMLENRELFGGKTVALILTGSNLTEQQMQEWF
jgi:threonine dehydratase